MTSLEITKKVAEILNNKKAQEINAYKVDDVTILADYFVIASGTNSTQVRTLAEEVEQKLSELGIEPHHIEGHKSQWILLDYQTVIVHIFYEETRDFYRLERLWADAERLDLSEIMK